VEGTLTQIIRKLEKYVYNLPAVRSQNTLTRQQRDIIQSVAQNVSLARSQTEFSLGDEDELAQRAGLKLASEQLQEVIAGILLASQHDIVSVIEVTQLTANAEMCIDRLTVLIKEK
jgi:hypothetical protein